MKRDIVMISNGGSGDGPLALWPEWGVDSRRRDSNMMMLILTMMMMLTMMILKK